MPLPTFIAHRDPRMRARIVSDRPLVYEGGPASSSERPKHVRAGSGLAWTGDRMVVVQDDADYIAVIEGGTGSVMALPLRGQGGARVGKGAGEHMNLEAVMPARDWRGEFVLAFGSGLGPEQRVVARMRLSAGDTELAVFDARGLYGALDDVDGLATSDLNIEGVALITKGIEGRDAVRLFHRGNRAARPGANVDRHFSATVDFRLDSLLAYLERTKRDPKAFLGFDLVNARRYDLDEYEGVPFTFTDAAAIPGTDRASFIALAETSEGCVAMALGVIEPDGNARYTIVVERDGAIARRRAEGMALSSATAGWLVVQPHDEEPATLAMVELTGL
jgi:hypothetical protein